MRALRARLTYANVVATLALVIAMVGGTAYAANTVFSSDIVNGEVKSADTRRSTDDRKPHGQAENGTPPILGGRPGYREERYVLLSV
jgi:hypothetical protein